MARQQKPSLKAHELEALLQASPSGIIPQEDLQARWRDVSRALQKAKSQQRVGQHHLYVYDAGRLTREAVAEMIRTGQAELGLPPFAAQIQAVLAQAAAPALLDSDIEPQIGSFFSMNLLSLEELQAEGIQYVELRAFQPFGHWYFSAQTEESTALDYAKQEAQRRHDMAWGEVAHWAGEELRTGAQNHPTDVRRQALARLYSRSQVDVILNLSERVIRVAAQNDYLVKKLCPDEVYRMRASDVHRLRDDASLRQALEDEVEVNLWQLRSLTDFKINYLRDYLTQNRAYPVGRNRPDSPVATVWYLWGAVRPIFWPEGGQPSIRELEELDQNEGKGRENWWSEEIIRLHRQIEERRQADRDQKTQARRQEREQREALRVQMLDNFPQWVRDEDMEQTATIHVGPTNSGKTHDAILELVAARSGWYLAPLRLLARELFERINQMGVMCNLITGEERIDLPGATITAATIEMFNPEQSGQCVVIDEAHMAADSQRGWAWTRAIVNSTAPNMQVITAPHGLSLVNKFLDSLGIEKRVVHHQRMVPLLIADQAWDLKNIPPKSIVVAFTRKDALQLKYLLQRQGRNVSVIYGALPPEVRLRQAHRFAYGETELCVATDAIGMGLNLPADNVVFTDLTKFDGFQMRRLKAGELQQIAGRAGRYGLSERGYVGAIDRPMLDMVRRLMTQSVPDEQYARLAPRPDEIELLQGDLVQRLLIWRELNAIPEVLRSIIKSTDLEDRLDLAQFLSYDDLMHLGVERALLLINAPARKESREYWIECATAILSDRALPLPPSPPKDIDAGPSLKEAEMCIACMEIYLWLGYRQPFAHLAHDLEGTMIQRDALTREIDVALLRKFDPEIGGRQGGRPRPAKSSSGAPRENGHRPPPNEKPRRGGTSSGQGRPRGGRR